MISYEDALKDIRENGIALGAGDYVSFDALQIAVKAIEKQIPKYTDCVERRYYTDHYCPECGKQQKRNPSANRMKNGWYCEKCGQKLIWGNGK